MFAFITGQEQKSLAIKLLQPLTDLGEDALKAFADACGMAATRATMSKECRLDLARTYDALQRLAIAVKEQR